MYSPHTGFQQCLIGLFNMYASCHINSWNLVSSFIFLFSLVLKFYLFTLYNLPPLVQAPSLFVPTLLFYWFLLLWCWALISILSSLFLVFQFYSLLLKDSTFLLILPPPSLFLFFSILMNFKVHLTSSLSRLYEHPSFPFSHLGPIFVKPRKFWWSARHNV